MYSLLFLLRRGLYDKSQLSSTSIWPSLCPFKLGVSTHVDSQQWRNASNSNALIMYSSLYPSSSPSSHAFFLIPKTKQDPFCDRHFGLFHSIQKFLTFSRYFVPVSAYLQSYSIVRTYLSYIHTSLTSHVVQHPFQASERLPSLSYLVLCSHPQSLDLYTSQFPCIDTITGSPHHHYHHHHLSTFRLHLALYIFNYRVP